MKKLLYLIGFATFSAANAQDSLSTTHESPSYAEKTMNKKFIWSIGVEPSIPLGNFNDFTSFGLGGSLQGEFKPGKRVGITVNVGYIDYFGKTFNDVKIPDYKYWPVMGGLKLYMSGKSYVHAQAGPGFGENGLGTSFWYGAGIGLNFSRAIDLELKYTGWKQDEIGTTGGTGGTGGTDGGGYPTGGTNGGNGGGTGGDGGSGGYGGHYPTIGLRLAYNF